MWLTAKMERWIETRLWNQKIQNESITIKQLVVEMSAFFNLDLTRGRDKQLVAKIRQIRWRVYKRHQRCLMRRPEFARQLGVPESMIQRWINAGWIDQRKPDTIKAVVGIIFERDYYYRFIEPFGAVNKIPEDPEISITEI